MPPLTLPLHPDGSSSSSPGGRALVFEAILIALFSLTLNLVGNGRISLWDRDEPRYAGATREMRASGDLIHPTFNAEPRYHKPVLIYWLMLVGTAIGGDNTFGVRLISSLAGVGSVMMVWWWGRKMLGAQVGRLSALILATAPIMVAESKLSTTDATLTFFVVLCQFALWELSRQDSRRMAALFWTSLGLAILTKSPAGPVIIGAAAAASWWWGGPTLAFAKRLHWKWGPLLALAIALPWNVAIYLLSHGEYYNVAVGYHMIQRATTGLEEHGGFPGYYVVTGMISFYPWSALLPAALVAAWARRKENPTAGFLLGWVIGPLVLLELVRTKLIHYYLPAFPAAAMLVGWLVGRFIEEGMPKLRDWRLGRFAVRLYCSVGFGMSAGLIVGSFFVPAPLRPPMWTLAVVTVAATVLCLREMFGGRIEGATRVMIGMSALSLLLATGWLLPAAEPYRISAIVGRRLASLEQKLGIKPVLATFQLPGTVYALGHPAPLVRTKADMIEVVSREGRVISALFPKELEVFQADPVLSVEICETVAGFNVDKGRQETLHLVVVRPKAAPADSTPVAAKPEASETR